MEQHSLEEWRDVIGYEERYQISNLGRLRSKDVVITKKDGKHEFRKGKILRLLTTKHGYLAYYFGNGKDKRKMIRIHRVVASAFIPNYEGKPMVDHINRNRKDNRVENLRWCTLKENMNNPLTLEHLKNCRPNFKHSEETKKKLSEINKGKHISESVIEKARLRGFPVMQFSIDGEFIKEFLSSFFAQKETDICRTHIISCCNGKRKTAGGFRWVWSKCNVERNSLLPLKKAVIIRRPLTPMQKQKSIEILNKVRERKKKKVVLKSECGDVLRIFDSIADAARQYKIGTYSICRCCKGIIKNTHGLIFSYYE